MHRASPRTLPSWLANVLAPACVALGMFASCGPSMADGSGEADWPAPAKKWFDRAQASFSTLDIQDAQTSIKHAFELEPARLEVRLLAANIALSQLDYDQVLSLLDKQESASAVGLRARALWYSGQLTQAAEELERLLDDPEVKDQWAQGVAQLARSGAGREPFRVTGALLSVVEMPRLPTPALIVPLELNGDPVLALVATGTPEVVLDSAQGTPSWVSLRFGHRLEVKDVPALTRDLSGLSRRLGAPIKLLLGVNLLRRLNVTFDFYGSQFVVRSFAPPPPPSASAIELSYIKGGGMVMQTRFGAEANASSAALLVDTGEPFPLAMTDSGWQKAGVQKDAFEPVPGDTNLKQGWVPRMTLGSFDVPRVPALSGLPLDRLEQGGGIHLDGVIGSALMAEFRVSLGEEGRTLWLEELPMPVEAQDGPAAAPPGGSSPPGSSPPPRDGEVPVSSRGSPSP